MAEEVKISSVTIVSYACCDLNKLCRRALMVGFQCIVGLKLNVQNMYAQYYIMIPDSIHVAFMHLRVDRLRASLFKDGCLHVQLQSRGCERRLEETGGPCLSM